VCRALEEVCGSYRRRRYPFCSASALWAHSFKWMAPESSCRSSSPGTMTPASSWSSSSPRLRWVLRLACWVQLRLNTGGHYDRLDYFAWLAMMSSGLMAPKSPNLAARSAVPACSTRHAPAYTSADRRSEPTARGLACCLAASRRRLGAALAAKRGHGGRATAARPCDSACAGRQQSERSSDPPYLTPQLHPFPGLQASQLRA
jgi:hypothetical protein